MKKLYSYGLSMAFVSASLVAVPSWAAKGGDAKDKKQTTTEETATLIKRQWPNAQFQIADAELQQLYSILDKGFEDPYIYELHTRAHNRLVRADLEYEVGEVLDSHPVAIQIRKKVGQDLAEAILEYRVAHLKGAAKAFDESAPGKRDGQYSEFLTLTREIAQAMGFPKDTRENAEVFFLGSGEVNAYTFSAKQNQIIAAVYEGLWELFNKDPEILRPVMLHELQHIMGRHIAMRAELITIFLSTGIDLIPDVEQASDGKQVDKDKLFEALAAKGFEHLAPVFMSLQKFGSEIVDSPLIKAAILKSIEKRGFAFNHDEATAVQAAFAESFNAHLANKILAAAQELRREIPKSERLALSKTLMKAMSGEVVTKGKKQAQANAEEEPEVDIKAYKKFLQKLDGIFSRSKEKTCDHMARALTNSSEAAAMPFVLMKGGKWANYPAMLRQGRELDEVRLHNPEFAVEEGSHPDISERIEYMESYSATDGYKVVSDPFLKNVHFYLLLSQEITEQEKASRGDRQGAVKAGMAQFKMEKAKAFAAELSVWVRAQLEAEYKKAISVLETVQTKDDLAKVDPTLKKFQTFLDILSSGQNSYYFDYYFGHGSGRRTITWSDWLKEFSRPNRLPYDLKVALESQKTGFEKELNALFKDESNLDPAKLKAVQLKLSLVNTAIQQLDQILPWETQSTGQQFRNSLRAACEEVLLTGELPPEGEGRG
jgi:Zn-dependent protease with chaperone function